MMQRLRLNVDRNIGFSATLSARALKVEGSHPDAEGLISSWRKGAMVEDDC
jgi:hypothetical protein